MGGGFKKAISGHAEKCVSWCCMHTYLRRSFNLSICFWLARRSSLCSATSLSRSLKESAHILYTMKCHISVLNHTHTRMLMRAHTHTHNLQADRRHRWNDVCKWYSMCINCSLLLYKCITMHCIHTPWPMLVQYGDTLDSNIYVSRLLGINCLKHLMHAL